MRPLGLVTVTLVGGGRGVSPLAALTPRTMTATANERIDLTRKSSAAATGSEAENLWNCFNHKKCERTAGSRRLRECGFMDSTRGVTGCSDIARWDLQKRTNARRTGRTRALQWGLPRLKAE